MRIHRLKKTGLLVIFCFVLQGLAFADTVQGRVASVSSSALNVVVYDNEGRAYPNALKLKVDKNTRFKGVSSAGFLRKQDPVLVDVRQENAGTWRADAVNKLQETSVIQKTQKPPSPNLMDALGSPTGKKIIRSGLMGAATGAVASGASGGKAGKGALVGAGVGIAGGLLSDMFSQRSQPQAQPSQTTVSTQEDFKN